MRDQKIERSYRTKLYEKYGYLIGVDTKELPEKHRSNNGGLRCFKKVLPRDEHKNKIRDGKKRRCGNTTAKGSLYCRHHGGANTKALVHGQRRDNTLEIYKGSYNNELGDLLIAFINDPKILDLKTELATLRLVLNNYIQKLASGQPDISPKKLNTGISYVLENPTLSQLEKFIAIKDIVDSQASLTDGNAVDRINRTVETIGKVVERIHRVETKEDFMLTPEGLKILMRAIIEILNINLEDPTILENVKQSLLEVSISTGGDLTKYDKGVINVTSHGKDRKI